MNEGKTSILGKKRPKIVHLVTGGGSGATRLVVDLALAQQEEGRFEPVLFLRKKANKLSPSLMARIEKSGIPCYWIANRWPKVFTINQMVRLCRELRPEIFVAHGNSEHLWGRMAAIKADVPLVVHVEHNRERYSFWRRFRARMLARKTDLTICVSESVAEHVKQLGMEGKQIVSVLNGVDSARFAAVDVPLKDRSDDIVMVARFGRQKDHATLIRAAKLLSDKGWTGHLILAGGGKPGLRRSAERLAQGLGIQAQVEFKGFVEDVPALLRSCKVSALSTHYEGLPLSLAESMAAGCAIVASEAPGVIDIVKDGVNGWLFPTGNADRMAELLHRALSDDPSVQECASHGRQDAITRFSVERMTSEYSALFAQLIHGAKCDDVGCDESSHAKMPLPETSNPS